MYVSATIAFRWSATYSARSFRPAKAIQWEGCSAKTNLVAAYVRRCLLLVGLQGA